MEDKTTLGFVILITWWKMNKSRYPILSDIAKDILVVLVFIVTFEYAFSASGQF